MKQLLDNGIVDTGSRAVRVSNAFHEHLNRHRENLLSRSQSVQEPSVQDTAAVICTNDNHARLISFQDVRNHFDQHPESNSAPLSRQVVQQKKNKKGDDNEANNRETDWEDIFHRCRRYIIFYIVTLITLMFYLYFLQIVWIERRLRRNSASLPQLSVPLLENLWSSLY